MKIFFQFYEAVIIKKKSDLVSKMEYQQKLAIDARKAEKAFFRFISTNIN